MKFFFSSNMQIEFTPKIYKYIYMQTGVPSIIFICHVWIMWYFYLRESKRRWNWHCMCLVSRSSAKYEFLHKDGFLCHKVIHQGDNPHVQLCTIIERQLLKSYIDRISNHMFCTMHMHKPMPVAISDNGMWWRYLLFFSFFFFPICNVQCITANSLVDISWMRIEVLLVLPKIFGTPRLALSYPAMSGTEAWGSAQHGPWAWRHGCFAGCVVPCRIQFLFSFSIYFWNFFVHQCTLSMNKKFQKKLGKKYLMLKLFIHQSFENTKFIDNK